MNKVSVIIPNYNHALYLRQRIDSVLEQSYQNFELLILDDCSPDNSKDIIAEYANHPKVSAVVFNEKNSGSTFKQWKKGIDLAKGDYIWIAESDDVADPLFLEKSIQALSSNSSVGLVQSQSFYYSSDNQVGEVFKTYQTPYKWDNDFFEKGSDFVKNAMMINNSLINASAIVFRKEAIKDSLMDTTFKLNGDWFLYLSILLKYDFYHLGSPLNYFRQHNNKGSSANVKNFNNLKEYANIISFLYKNLDLTNNQKDTLRFIFVQKWLKQNSGSLKNTLSNQFFPIAKKAFANDPLFILRLLKLYFKKSKSKSLQSKHK